MKRIDWALISLTTLILLLAASGAAIASEPQITLAPGTWRVVEFTNTENERENLTITNISAPDVILPYVFVTPTSIPPLSSENVTVQFAYIPVSVRQSVPQDVFAVKIDGLLVYLDLSVPLPENAENRWAEIDVRIDALEASLSGQIESLIVRMVALESENWALEIESLHENVGLGFDGLLVWVKSELDRIDASIPENSHPVDVEWYVKLLDNREAKIRAAIGNDIANMQIEERMADAESEIDQALYIGFAAIVVAIVAVAVSITRSRATTPSPKVPRKFLTSEVAPEDKVAMLANEIGAMRERGEDADAIREKEQELATLKSQLKPKKRGKK